MKPFHLALALLTFAAGTARAQPVGDPEAPPAPPGPGPAPTPAPTPGPAPMTPPAGHEHHWMEHEHADDGPERPTDFAIGIGLGYVLPTSLEIPNTTTVRFRLASGLTFEPQVVFAHTSDSIDTGMSVSQGTTEIGVGTQIRYPLMRRGKVDLELLGNLFIDSSDQDPPGDDNNTTITTLSLGYGLGVSYWLGHHWNISLSAGNPIVTYSKNRIEMGPDTVTVTSSTTIGAVFDPKVTLMVHLYN